MAHSRKKARLMVYLKTCTLKNISILQLMFSYTEFAVLMKSLEFYRSHLHSLKYPYRFNNNWNN